MAQHEKIKKKKKLESLTGQDESVHFEIQEQWKE